MLFGVGMTTVACFQKAASVAWASGSAAMALRIWAPLRLRSLFQPLPGLAFEILPIGSSFVRLRAPGRDDAAIFLRVR